VNDTLTVSRPALSARRPDLVPALLVTLVTVIVLALVSTTLRTPDMVSLTVNNPSAWRAEVSVRGADDADWTDAGAVSRDGELTFLRLPDQGADWVVKFSYADVVSTVEVTRDQLAASDWVVEVPASFSAALEEAGVQPTTGSTAGLGSSTGSTTDAG
jgi:hypothetical protein